MLTYTITHIFGKQPFTLKIIVILNIYVKVYHGPTSLILFSFSTTFHESMTFLLNFSKVKNPSRGPFQRSSFTFSTVTNPSCDPWFNQFRGHLTTTSLTLVSMPGNSRLPECEAYLLGQIHNRVRDNDM